MCTKFGAAVRVADMITCDKFFGDRLRGVDSVGIENCHLPLTKPVAVNTGLALRTAQPVMALSHVNHLLLPSV